MKKKQEIIDAWQLRFPTLVDDVAVVVAKFVDIYFLESENAPSGQPTKVSGIFHMSALTLMTKHDIVVEIGKALDIATAHIISDKNPPQGGTRRPHNAQLDISKTVQVLGEGNVPHTPFQSVIKKILAPFLT